MVRRIVVCSIGYMTGHPDKGYPGTLSDMGPDGDSCLDEEHASGTIGGYRIEYQPANIVSGLNTGFTVRVTPVEYGAETGKSFYSDDSGVIRVTTEDRPATVNDPPM